MLSKFMLLQNTTAHLKPPETRLIKLHTQNILPHGSREAENGCLSAKLPKGERAVQYLQEGDSRPLAYRV